MNTLSSSLRDIRSFSALVVAAFFSGATFIPACCDTGQGAEDPGPPIDGMKACIDYCDLSRELCTNPATIVTCEEECEIDFRNAGEYCKGKLSQHYGCLLSKLQARAAADAGDLCAWGGCEEEYSDVRSCMDLFGCYAAPYHCNYNGIDAGHCACEQICKKVAYSSVCDLSGTAFTCNCYIDNVLIGTCNGSAEAVCDWKLWNGCCNQYFNL